MWVSHKDQLFWFRLLLGDQAPWDYCRGVSEINLAVSCLLAWTSCWHFCFRLRKLNAAGLILSGGGGVWQYFPLEKELLVMFFWPVRVWTGSESRSEDPRSRNSCTWHLLWNAGTSIIILEKFIAYSEAYSGLRITLVARWSLGRWRSTERSSSNSLAMAVIF